MSYDEANLDYIDKDHAGVRGLVEGISDKSLHNSTDSESIADLRLIPLPHEEGLTTKEVIVLLRDRPVTVPILQRVPEGPKNNVYCLVSISTHQRCYKTLFKDDCGPWDIKSSLHCSYPFIDREGLRRIFWVASRKKYCKEVQIGKTRSYIPLDPQPAVGEVFTVARYTCSHSTAINYKRRVTWLKGTGDVTTAVFEYYGGQEFWRGCGKTKANTRSHLPSSSTQTVASEQHKSFKADRQEIIPQSSLVLNSRMSEDEEHRKKLCGRMYVFQQAGILCDTVLKVQDAQMLAHSLILASASSKLRTLLVQSNGTDEVTNPADVPRQRYVIELVEFSTVDVQILLQVAYTGSLPLVLPKDREASVRTLFKILDIDVTLPTFQSEHSIQNSDTRQAACVGQLEQGKNLQKTSAEGVETSWADPEIIDSSDIKQEVCDDLSMDDESEVQFSPERDVDAANSEAKFGVRSYTCKVCQSQCERLSELKRHYREHRDDELRTLEIAGINASDSSGVVSLSNERGDLSDSISRRKSENDAASFTSSAGKMGPSRKSDVMLTKVLDSDGLVPRKRSLRKKYSELGVVDAINDDDVNELDSTPSKVRRQGADSRSSKRQGVNSSSNEVVFCVGCTAGFHLTRKSNGSDSVVFLDSKSTSCPVCATSFGVNVELRQHICGHDLIAHQCNVCDICLTSFDNEDEFLEHVLANNSGSCNKLAGLQWTFRTLGVKHGFCCIVLTDAFTTSFKAIANKQAIRFIGDSSVMTHKKRQDSLIEQVSQLNDRLISEELTGIEHLLDESLSNTLSMSDIALQVLVNAGDSSTADMFTVGQASTFDDVRNALSDRAETNNSIDRASKLKDDSLALYQIFSDKLIARSAALQSNSDWHRAKRRMYYWRDRVEHSGDALQYECDQCTRTFLSLPSFIRHEKTHATVFSYRCDICGDMFKYESGVLRHKLKTHASVTDLCALCGCEKSACSCSIKMSCDDKQTTQPTSEEKQHLCSDCSQTFPSSADLEVHSKIHKIKCKVPKTSTERSQICREIIRNDPARYAEQREKERQRSIRRREAKKLKLKREQWKEKVEVRKNKNGFVSSCSKNK